MATSFLQVTPQGLRQIRSDGRTNEWRAPGRRNIVHRRLYLRLGGGQRGFDGKQPGCHPFNIGVHHRDTLAKSNGGNGGGPADLIEAGLLVLVVILIFLQDWRAMLVPATTVPVTIIGGDTEQRFTVDQTQPMPTGEAFRPVGSLRLRQGVEYTLTVTNQDTKGFVIVDAFQLLPVAAQAK